MSLKDTKTELSIPADDFVTKALSILVCPGCGKDAACDCGVAPITRAQYALINNPDKSNRAVAKAAGVSEATVRRARKPTASSVAVEKRTGRDGKRRKLPKSKPTPDAKKIAFKVFQTLGRFADEIGSDSEPALIVQELSDSQREQMWLHIDAVESWINGLRAALDKAPAAKQT